MNEDILNMEDRKFLKQVGVTSQREIERVIVKAVEEARLKGDETLNVKMTLDLPELNVNYDIEGTIALE